MIAARGLILLIVACAIVAASIGGSNGGKAGTPPNGPTPAASLSPAPSVPPAIAPSPTPEPTPQPLTHRKVVLERFLCENCHSFDSGWLLPESHLEMRSQTCESCHAPAPEPAAAAVHLVPGDTATGELCVLCHVDSSQTELRPIAPALSPWQECSDCHRPGQRVEAPVDHDGRSTATCGLCHQTETLEASEVPHRVKGWEDCSFCHAPRRLAPMKGSHKGIADNKCMDCHEVVKDPPALLEEMRDHSEARGGCSSCHAEDRLAPLPGDHLERSEATCELCHSSTWKLVPSAPHSLVRQPTCSSCHTPRSLAGVDGHADRSDATCKACHAESTNHAPNNPHTDAWRDNCTACHAPSTPPPHQIPAH